MIIAVSGVDCAGKSTQINLLKQYFISQGKTCCKLWYRPGYSAELQSLKKIIHPLWVIAKNPLHPLIKPKNKQKSSETSSNSKTQEQTTAHIPAPLWLTTAILDTAIQYAIKLRLLEMKYDVVICDRYIHDAIFDLTFKYPNFTMSEDILNALKKTFPKVDKTLLLWLPYDLVLQRAEIKNEPIPDTPEIRKMRWRAYQFLQDKDDIISIDASGTIEEVHQKILAAIRTA